MRRLLSIWMMLLLGLPPLASALSIANGDLRLPACCRRNGAHHCGMIDSAAAAADSASSPQQSQSTVIPRCPFLSHIQLASTTPVHAITSAPLTVSVASNSSCTAQSNPTSYTHQPLCHPSDRAPPASQSI